MIVQTFTFNYYHAILNRYFWSFQTCIDTIILAAFWSQKLFPIYWYTFDAETIWTAGLYFKNVTFYVNLIDMFTILMLSEKRLRFVCLFIIDVDINFTTTPNICTWLISTWFNNQTIKTLMNKLKSKWINLNWGIMFIFPINDIQSPLLQDWVADIGPDMGPDIGP